jgi:hypothetical protein
MIRLNTPIESLVINLQSAGNVQYNIQYVIVRQGTRLEKSTEGLLTSSGQNVVLINDFSSGYFDITYINVTNIDPTENFISVLKKTNVSEFNLTSEAIGLKNRECTEFTSESGFKVLDQNGSFKTITESVSADGDVENSDMSYMASVPSGGTLTLPDSDIEVNGVGEGQVVSVKTISVDLNDGTDPVNPTLVTLVGNTLTITLAGVGDVTVENSDASYQVVEPSGGTLVLPDSQINVNGNDEGDVVSVKPINVNVTDGVDPIVPDSINLVGNTLTLTITGTGGDVDIEINGVPYDSITAPATVDIPIINSVPAPVGTITGTDIIVADSSAVIKNSAGTTLKTEAIPAEVSENITINDSTAVIKDSAGATLKSEPILAEASENITINDSTVNVRKSDSTLISAVAVKAEATTSYNVSDSTAVIKDSAGTTIKSEPILAATSEDITINDSTAVIKNSAGTTIKSENILAEASENITINDSTAVIKDSAGTTIKSEGILAEASENITINDSVAVLKDSAAVTLDTVNLLAEETKNITLDDFNVEVEDPLGSVILTDSYLAYSENTLNLTALASTMVVVGTGITLTISPTAPLTPTEGDIWLQPI